MAVLKRYTGTEWETVGAPIGSSVRDFDQKTRTAGNVSTSSTSFVDIDTALDIVLTAAAGDWLEIGVNGLWSNQGVFGRMEAFTWVSAAPVNGVSGASNGVPGWLGVANGFTVVGAPILYTVQAGDVSSGTVTLRFRYKVDSASSKTLHAESAAPFRTWGRNLGVPPA